MTLLPSEMFPPMLQSAVALRRVMYWDQYTLHGLLRKSGSEHAVDFHSYSDDAQLYLSMKQSKAS